MDTELIKKVFYEPHSITIEKLREFANSPEVYEMHEKILYIFFFTENDEYGVEPFLKDEKNKCFTPIHDDFLMSGERFVYIAIPHEFVEDVVTQDIINDDILLPEELAHFLIRDKEESEAEFINLLSEKWSNDEISECL